MPKVKTKKTIVKRFKVTKSGIMLRGHQYSRHRRSHKPRSLRKSYKKKIQLTKLQTKILKRFI